MQFTSTANVWKRRCCTGGVVHCRAPKVGLDSEFWSVMARL